MSQKNWPINQRIYVVRESDSKNHGQSGVFAQGSPDQQKPSAGRRDRLAMKTCQARVSAQRAPVWRKHYKRTAANHIEIFDPPRVPAQGVSDPKRSGDQTVLGQTCTSGRKYDRDNSVRKWSTITWVFQGTWKSMVIQEKHEHAHSSDWKGKFNSR